MGPSSSKSSVALSIFSPTLRPFYSLPFRTCGPLLKPLLRATRVAWILWCKGQDRTSELLLGLCIGLLWAQGHGSVSALNLPCF